VRIHGRLDGIPGGPGVDDWERVDVVLVGCDALDADEGTAWPRIRRVRITGLRVGTDLRRIGAAPWIAQSRRGAIPRVDLRMVRAVRLGARSARRGPDHRAGADRQHRRSQDARPFALATVMALHHSRVALVAAHGLWPVAHLEAS